MQRMLLVLKRSPPQEAALRKLLDDQQDKSSPNYHKWLTPAEFGKQFGPTDTDIQTITSWLQSHGFEVGTTKGRTVLEFSGSASQVQEAFHTTIHKYIVNEEQHWANSTDPSIPSALTPAVAGVSSLNNFPTKPMNRFVGGFSRNKATGRVRAATPLFTYNPGYACSADDYCFALGPYDFATIYNVLPLWNSNINGTGQTIAIVAESNINPQDVANFRSLFGLPANSTANGNPLNIILNGPDPGLEADESEADIDSQWSGAVAPYATIDFVVSQSTETTTGTDLSAVYIVDNNLAAVMSESYGFCELGLGTAGNQFFNALWQQAAAQGITVFISAGDNGSAGCDAFGVRPPAPAVYGLEVSGYASTPYNVAVGGTDFYEFTDPEAYWSTTNNSTTQASAVGYIPETTWNDSCTNAIWETVNGLSQNPETNCNNSRLNDAVPGGGSGGASTCTTPSGQTPASCGGGYAKPSWQSGTGVPVDNKRDLPDVSLFASNGFAGSFYIVCESDQEYGSCSSSSPDQEFLGYGGTSVSSPAFAGIMALVNQQTGSRQGNANYVFYKLAAKDTLASCNSSSSPASSCIFNDVTMGTIAMPCATGSPNCTTSISGDQYGILTGYNAGTGYDQATGLGSVNANNLVTQWSSVSSMPSTTTLNSLTPTTITHGQSVSFSVTVKPESGTGTPTGEISLVGGSSGSSPASAGFNLAGGTASGTTELLPGGTYSVTARYAGDSTYASSESNPISVTVSKENTEPQLFLVTYDSNGKVVNPDTTTAVYGSPYLLRVNVENSAGAMCTPVSSPTATGCPSGTVTMTDNGSPLDAGTYTLNSYGYFEDLIVQLPGGTDSVKAAYGGDNSFNASSITNAITITPAATSTSQPYVNGGAAVGQSVGISTYIPRTNPSIRPGP
jgi:subtilase family serine protease